MAIAGRCVGQNLNVATECRCADVDGDSDVDLTDVAIVRANLRRTGFPTGPNPCVPADPRDVDNDRDGTTENQGDCDDTNAAIHPSAAERCNSIDDNCDQTIDEGFALGSACTAGVGPCQRTGVTVCSADGSTTACDATPGAPAPESCNGIDDDCDGVADDGFNVGGACTVGVGACARAGSTVCTPDGTATACDATPGTPAAETCNGADDDCDGTTDDGFDVGDACTAGLGACVRNGQKVCAPDGSGTLCDAVAGDPVAETCNGLDDNCDGTTDDGFDVGAPCTVGVGACAATGTKVCTAAGASTECNVSPGNPQTEVCDNGIDEDCNGEDLACVPQISISITAPANLSLFTDPLVEVAGAVDPSALTVECNGFSTLRQGDQFTGEVSLREGRNPVSCVARNASGIASVDTVQLVLDTTPPKVVIESPPDGFITSNSQIDVTGAVADISSAAVELAEMHVMVNGIEAAVSNRAFVAPRFLLQPGQNTIMAMATDAAGNVGSAKINVTLLTQGEEFLQELSGNTQGGTIGEPLANPLVVRVVDRRGNPVPGRSVKFAVTRGDGTVEAFPEKGQSVSVNTDDSGLASVTFVLGTRVGSGNNQVTASVLGIPGGVIFCASSSGLPPQRIVVLSGGNQTGAVGTNLPVPLITLVTDLLGNPVPGVDVRYAVAAGGGTIDGGTTFTDVTDSDGQAAAVLTLGPSEGSNNNIVNATFQGLQESPATFLASALVTGPEAGTSVSGLVLDNQDDPVPNVTASIDDTTLSAVTDAEGRFAIPGAPVGAIALTIDGTTTTRPGTWPVLQFQINTVCGRDNTVGMPIRLLPIDVPGGKVVGGNQDVTIQMAGVPGAELTVFKNSVTFPDGSKTGVVSFTQVHTDKVPMIAPLGSHFMLAFTVQPRGTAFDPPARVAIPNSGMAPGTVVEMFSFDHDIDEFVSIGTASVTEDGTQLKSNPGFGIRKAGWGGCVPPPPPPSCVSSCDDGNPCTDDSCVDGSCQHTPVADGTPCDAGDCGACQGGSCSPTAGDGTTCDDGDQCTDPDECSGGQCMGDPVTNDECCDGAPFDQSSQCCENGEVLDKLNIADLADCPNKTARPGYAPSPNGCGPAGTILGGIPAELLVPDNPNIPTIFCPTGGPAFVPGCDNHDVCYGTCNSVKGDCEAGFFNDNVDTCLGSLTSLNPACLSQCLANAALYPAATGTFGGGAFDAAQKEACICCP